MVQWPVFGKYFKICISQKFLSLVKTIPSHFKSIAVTSVKSLSKRVYLEKCLFFV